MINYIMYNVEYYSILYKNAAINKSNSTGVISKGRNAYPSR